MACLRTCSCFVRVYLVVVICFISAKTASAKGGGGGSYGTTVCPCFCSVRTGDDTSPYWDYNFGEEADFKCSTPCYKTSDAEFNQLGHCGDVVSQYELGGFCGRAFQVANTTFPKLFDPTGTTVVDSTPSSYLASLDEHASICASETLEEGEAENLESNCRSAVKKGGCHTVFPMCDPNADGAADSKGTPLPICESFCVNERTACRTVGSAFGHKETIRRGCAGSPWVAVNEDGTVGKGPSTTCTSSSAGTLHRGRTGAAPPLLMALLATFPVALGWLA